MYWLARRGGTPWAKLGGALPGEEENGEDFLTFLKMGENHSIFN